MKVKLHVLVGPLIAGRGSEKGVAKIDHQKIGTPTEKDHQGYKVQVDGGILRHRRYLSPIPSQGGKHAKYPSGPLTP